MARRRTKAAKQAHALLVWLESLELPARVINALRRDLKVVTGEREGEEGAGVLAGFDQARFTEELYQKRGGQVGKVPSVAASAIETLRAAIPTPVSGDAIEAAREAQGDAAPESAEAAQMAESDDEQADASQEGVGEAQDDDEPADAAQQSADAAQEGDEPAPERTPEAMPAVTVAALADAQEELIAEAGREAVEGAADVAPEVGTEPVEAPAAPKRRGRPPRAAAAAAVPAELAVAPEAPAKRRGRPPRDEAASEAAVGLPPRTRRARVAAAREAAQPAASPVQEPPPAPVVPAAPPVTDPSFVVLLRLWRELHPQGQRAAMHFMADLAGEA